LTQQVIQYQDKTTRLELLLKQKDKDGEELKRRLKAGQIATEGIIFEKIELSSKLQEMQKEVEEQRRRINELISINEELLEISQIKEDEVQYAVLTIFYFHCSLSLFLCT
jgi:seryl-tRNA synthetase